MSLENPVSSVADTQNPATDLTNESPEIVTPEPTDPAAPQTSDKDERDKALARMERRINKKHAEAAAANERARMLEERLASYERAAPTEAAPTEGTDPKAIEAKARELAGVLVKEQEFAARRDAILAEGRAFPDFDKACNAVHQEIPFYDRTGKPTDFLLAVQEFDKPAQLLQHIGTNPDLLEELADLSPVRLVRRLDAIERELTDKAKPKVSSAPKPLEPVKGQGGDAKDPSAMSDAEFAAWRRRQIAQRR